MAQIRTRRDLATLLERQMAAASARFGAAPQDDDVEARTALKTYLLEAHGRMRSDPAAAIAEVAAAAGLEVRSTDEPELIALAQGEIALWLDTSGGRFVRLYTTASVKDADRVHEAITHASAMLECVRLLPRRLESLGARVDGKMVLFSLRHDRRPLRRDAGDDPDGIDFVTLRFWAPSAADTLTKLRSSAVLPGATSVNSVRLRAGDDEAYAVAEVFHNGKVTAVGSSFAQHDRIVRAALEDYMELAAALETGPSGPRRVTVPVHWTAPDLGYSVAKMFSGADPFRMWGLPAAVGDDVYRVRAVDVGIGQCATFEVSRAGVSFELAPGAPAGLAARFVANLQYHVDADTTADALSPEPLLARGDKAGRGHFGPAFDERSPVGDVARAVLAEACACWVRGAQTLGASALAASAQNVAKPTPAAADLARRVMTEAAAYEWHEWLKPVLGPDGATQWRWLDRLALDGGERSRQLVRLNRHAQQLVARLSGGAIAPWLQLSLFGAAQLVPPVSEE